MSIKESDAIKHYVDPKTGYWGKTKQLKKYRIMLNKIYALQRHKEVTSKHLKKQYKREGAVRPLFSVQVDLADFPKLQNPLNNNIRYLLICIDVFSRYLWVLPLKNKSNLHIALDTVFQQIKKDFHSTPENVTGDNEFDTNQLKHMANKYKFKWWFGDPEEKYRTGIVERVIRTLRNLIKRYLTQNNTTKYIDVLQDLVDNYNDTEHGHTRSRPKVAIKSGQTFPKPSERKIAILRAGDSVRILQKRKRAFDKGDKPYYSEKTYEIVRKDGNKYVLRDTEKDEILNKTYYIHQLLNVKHIIHDQYDKQNNNDNLGYDKGIKHKSKQRRNKRALRGLDINNIVDKNERKQVRRGLSYNDDEVFHDRPLPKNINDRQLEKKRKQLERYAQNKYNKRHKKAPKKVRKKKVVGSTKSKVAKSITKPKTKPKPKIIDLTKPKLKRKRYNSVKPVRAKLKKAKNLASIRHKKIHAKNKSKKSKPKISKKQQIKLIKEQIKANRKKRMVVVRLRRRLAKLLNN